MDHDTLLFRFSFKGPPIFKIIKLFSTLLTVRKNKLECLPLFSLV